MKIFAAGKIPRMKKYIAIVISLLLALAVMPAASSCASSDSPIRIHIRANSDGEKDQAVKYIVRDEIVDYLSSPLAAARGREDAYRIISSRLDGIKNTAADKLSECGFSYGANAYMSYEYFPDRDYGDVTYPAGYYDALIVELGTGTGGNWWCVAYPPLCFYGDDGEEFGYSSIIAELLGL